MSAYKACITIFAILCVTSMTIVALCLGHDGAVFLTGVTLVGGGAGWGIAKATERIAVRDGKITIKAKDTTL